MIYKLTESGLKKANSFISECRAKRKEILDAGKDSANDTNLPTIEDIESDIWNVSFDGLKELDEDYYNCWGVTDNYSSDLPLHLVRGKDFVYASEGFLSF